MTAGSRDAAQSILTTETLDRNALQLLRALSEMYHGTDEWFDRVLLMGWAMKGVVWVCLYTFQCLTSQLLLQAKLAIPRIVALTCSQLTGTIHLRSLNKICLGPLRILSLGRSFSLSTTTDPVGNLRLVTSTPPSKSSSPCSG